MWKFKQKTRWDISCAALLLQTYLDMTEKNQDRRQAVNALKKDLDHYVYIKNQNIIDEGISISDINRQLGLLEYLMTDGKRGLMGMPLACIKEIVNVYRTNPELYRLYVEQGRGHETEITLIGGSVDGDITKGIESDTNISNEVKDPIYGKKEGEGQGEFGSVSDEVLCQQKLSVTDEEKTPDNEERKYYGISLNSSVTELPLPNRIIHCLQWKRILTVKELLTYPKNQLANIPGMGSKSLKTLFHALPQIRREALLFSKMDSMAEELTNTDNSKATIAVDNNRTNVSEWIASLSLQLHIRKGAIMACLRAAGAERKTCISELRPILWNNDKIQSHLWDFIFRKQSKEKIVYTSVDELKKWFPTSFYDEAGFQGFLEALERQNRIEVQEDFVQFDCLSLEEYIQEISDERNHKIVSMRLDGFTLEAIARETGITRERVRQIQRKYLLHHQILKEDRYKDILNTYPAIGYKDLQRIFGLSDRICQYLNVTLNREKSYTDAERQNALMSLARDSSLTVIERERAKALIEMSDSDFYIHGQKVKKNRPSLIRYIVRTYAQDKTACSTLKKYYDRLLMDLGLTGDPSFEVDLRYFDHLADYTYTLWNRKKMVRYYDIWGNDYDELLETLHLEQFSDVEFSTLKFFREYPDVMEKYDIRDEYELHNLLKKVLAKQDYQDKSDKKYQITFGKMPMIKIGNPNKAKQILKIIEENGPVTKAKIGKLYEKAYGVKSTIFQSNTKWEEFEPYCINGEYMMQHENKLSPDIIDEMKRVLKEDFYTKKEILELYLETVPEGNVWDIDNYTLHQMGYASHESYVVKEIYKNASDFFRKILTDGDVIDLRDKQHYRIASTYYTVLSELSSQYQIVEVEPDVFYTKSYLEQLGITTEKIQQFCNTIKNFVPANTLFTIESVCKHGLHLPWSMNHLGNYFYSSILAADKMHFSSLLCGGDRLLWNGTRKTSLSVGELFIHVLDATEEILSDKEMQMLIQKKYGLYFKTDKIKEFAMDHDEYATKLIL